MPPLNLTEEQLKKAQSILSGGQIANNPFTGMAGFTPVPPVNPILSTTPANTPAVPPAPIVAPAPGAPVTPKTAPTTSTNVPTIAGPTPTTQGGLQGILGEIQGLTPEQKQLLGLSETPEQKTQREALSSSLQRLISLQSQLAQAGVPSEGLRNLDKLIGEQTQALKGLTPESFLKTQKGLQDVGISQGQLERVTAQQREPIARGLADLLMSRSVMAQNQQAQVEQLQAQVSGIETETTLREAIGKLSAPTGLPSAVQNEILKKFLSPAGETAEISEYSLAKQQGFKGSLIDYKKEIANLKQSAITGGSDLVNAVLANPALFDTLTPTAKTALAPALFRAGFTEFGKPLSDTAITQLSDSQTAKEGLEELKGIIIENSDLVGPVRGFAKLNPFSKAQRVQARIDAVRQRVGKALEGGVLRKEDEEKYKKILATITDTPETAISKINFLMNDIERQLDNFITLQKVGGRNVGALTSGALDTYLSQQGY